ncbi:MAG: hypothetical protein KIS73_19595 [Enhydrobacter sp.]|nr:hypothetical protein [Enhydrobacter sp.]
MTQKLRITDVQQTTTDILVSYQTFFDGDTTATSLTVAYSATSFAASSIPLAGIVAGIAQQQQLQEMMANLRRDISAMIGEAVRELKRCISEVIDRETMQRAQADVDAAWRNLKDWGNSSNPREAIFRLNEAEIAANNVIYRLHPHGAKALFPYINAVSLKMIILMTRSNFLKDDGDLRNARELYNESVPHISQMLDELHRYWDGLIAGVTPVRSMTTGGLHFSLSGRSSWTPVTGYAWYTDNGDKRREIVQDSTYLNPLQPDFTQRYEDLKGRLQREAQTKGERSRDADIAKYVGHQGETIRDVVAPSLATTRTWRLALFPNG